MNHLSLLYLSDSDLCVYRAHNIGIRCVMLKEFFSNVDEIKVMEISIVVFSRNGSWKVLLYQSNCIVLYTVKIGGVVFTQWVVTVCQAVLLRIHR